MLERIAQSSITAKSSGNHLMEQLRLHTFGGLVLHVGGVATTGAATRRRRLALLALLALARERGLSRDKIHAYLWPESEPERARHGLNQLVYFQRHHLDNGELFLGKKTLRLNPQVITSDVWEFEDAFDKGAYETAVRLYLGPFLDGFFVNGAPEFERWASDQRRRLGDRCARALGALATAAAAKGDHRQAVEWWNRAAELNPYDTDTALHLAQEWVAAGDRSAALRCALHHTDVIQTDLGTRPDARVGRMIDELRNAG
jgi:DNA-binding SARP family transcriptional activator